MLINPRHKLEVKRKPNKIYGDIARVITQPHLPDDPHRISMIIQRVARMSEGAASLLLADVLRNFSNRHENLLHIFERHFKMVKGYIFKCLMLSESKKALIGAYFTKEYAIEAAALFNPSIVPHPDQHHLEKGSIRFVMSLRATGEGHISSIVFRSGVLNRHNIFQFDPVSDFVETPNLKPNPSYKRRIFAHKLMEMNANNDVSAYILNQLPEGFSKKDLIREMNTLDRNPHFSKKSE